MMSIDDFRVHAGEIGRELLGIESALEHFRVAWHNKAMAGGSKDPYEENGTPLYRALTKRREELRQKLIDLNAGMEHD
jgi:hypothetical protein